MCPPDLEKFDFDAHRAKAIAAYGEVRPLYAAFCERLKNILIEALHQAGVVSASIDARAKDAESFGDKAVTPSDSSPEEPKYRNPMADITDMAGARVITYFPKSVSDAEGVIRVQFEVLERIDKSESLLREERFGYQSIHFLVRLSQARLGLSEYARYQGLIAEVQVRTILQHAWAEIEHDIQYKAIDTLPAAIGRRFASLAGLFEIADREFQAIQDEDARLRAAARRDVTEGRLEQVEITPDALKAYLDQKLGADGRMKNGAYDWQAKLLRAWNFTNFRQLDEVLAAYDDDRVSRVVWGSRTGQLSRFEMVLFAALGQPGIDAHPFANLPWWRDFKLTQLQALQAAGIPLGTRTLPQPVTASASVPTGGEASPPPAPP